MRIDVPETLPGDVLLRRLRPDDAPAYAAAFGDDPELGRLLGMEGVLRKRNVERGQRVDVVWFGVLREEWR